MASEHEWPAWMNQGPTAHELAQEKTWSLESMPEVDLEFWGRSLYSGRMAQATTSAPSKRAEQKVLHPGDVTREEARLALLQVRGAFRQEAVRDCAAAPSTPKRRRIQEN